MLVTKYDIESAQAIIDKHIDMINHRYDCSDFYLVSLLKIWIDFRDEEIFSEEFWGKIQSCILDLDIGWMNPVMMLCGFLVKITPYYFIHVSSLRDKFFQKPCLQTVN